MPRVFSPGLRAFHAFLAAGLVACLSPRDASATTYRVTESAPDSTAYATAGVHWGGLGRNYPKSLGLNAQVTLPILPAVELQGGGMLHLTKASMLRLEGGFFLGIPFARNGADIELSRGYAGPNQATVESAFVSDAVRKKFGLDAGLSLDRRAAYYYDRSSPKGETALTLSSLGAHAGLKFIRQVTAGVQAGGQVARRVERFTLFFHALYAIKQSYDKPAGETEDRASRYGGRFGFEWALNVRGDWGGFVKFEAGATPSLRGPDFYSFTSAGVCLGRSVF